MNRQVVEKQRWMKLLLWLFAAMTAERINPRPPMTIRTGEAAPSHAIFKALAINLELVRDVSIMVSLFLNMEMVFWPELTRFNPTPSGILLSWCKSHTLLERMPMAVRQPPAHASLPREVLPGQTPLIRLFLSLIVSPLPLVVFEEK